MANVPFVVRGKVRTGKDAEAHLAAKPAKTKKPGGKTYTVGDGDNIVGQTIPSTK